MTIYQPTELSDLATSIQPLSDTSFAFTEIETGYIIRRVNKDKDHAEQERKLQAELFFCGNRFSLPNVKPNNDDYLYRLFIEAEAKDSGCYLIFQVLTDDKDEVVATCKIDWREFLDAVYAYAVVLAEGRDTGLSVKQNEIRIECHETQAKKLQAWLADTITLDLENAKRLFAFLVWM